MSTGSYQINDVALTGLADKFGIRRLPRRLHTEHPDLLDHNVNGWLTRTDRRFLIRVLRGNTEGE